MKPLKCVTFQSIRKKEIYYVETPSCDFVRGASGTWYYDMPHNRGPVEDELKEDLEDAFQRWLREVQTIQLTSVKKKENQLE